MEMMLEGRTLAPREALEAGLVQAVVPRDEVKDAAIQAGERLARRSPVAVRALKRAVYEGGSRPLERGLAKERKWFMVSSATESSKRKMAAMTQQVSAEGRSPWADEETIHAWQEGTAADGEPGG
jgi:enoyl-CoA hydratase/carnithine racemase